MMDFLMLLAIGLLVATPIAVLVGIMHGLPITPRHRQPDDNGDIP